MAFPAGYSVLGGSASRLKLSYDEVRAEFKAIEYSRAREELLRLWRAENERRLAAGRFPPYIDPVKD